MDIEAALQWAYRDELPKGDGGGGLGMYRAGGFVDYGVSIDKWDTEPGFPSAMGDPHPDALAIEAAVNKLQPMPIDAAAHRDWLAPECAAMIDADDRIMRNLIVDVRPYVAMHAKMGTRPEWRVEWHISRRIGGNGSPIVLGMDTRRRYLDGSHCPLEIAPDPREVLNDRAEYTCWHEALMELTDALAGRLSDRIVLPPEAPARPWVDGETRRAILADLTARPFPARNTARLRAS
ncbi:MAG: hypothetical protein AB7F22_10515 [Reyranella sp.]|uniref:hypothetical protein n=1 Tax=Reyranella sp. TaxID=1929291 RepID=UPI003D0BF926